MTDLQFETFRMMRTAYVHGFVAARDPKTGDDTLRAMEDADREWEKVKGDFDYGTTAINGLVNNYLGR